MPIDRKLFVSPEGKLKISADGQLADKACCCGCLPGGALPPGAPYFSSVVTSIDFDFTAEYTTPINACDAVELGFLCGGTGTVPIGTFSHFTRRIGPDLQGDPDILVGGPVTPDNYPETCDIVSGGTVPNFGGFATSGSWCEYQPFSFGENIVATVGACPIDPETSLPCADSGEVWIYIMAVLQYGTLNEEKGWHLSYGSFWEGAGSTAQNICGCIISGAQCETLFLGPDAEDYIGTFTTPFDYFTLSFTLSSFSAPPP